MQGEFPVMMFDYQRRRLAIYQTNKPENKKVVGGLMLSPAFNIILNWYY